MHTKPMSEYTYTGYVDRGLCNSFDDLSHKPVSISRAIEHPVSVKLPNGNTDCALNNDGTTLATDTPKHVNENRLRSASVGAISIG